MRGFRGRRIRRGKMFQNSKWVLVSNEDKPTWMICQDQYARLVVRGFEQTYSVEYFETFAASPSVTSIDVVHPIGFKTK